jgi:hypothetical protein
LVPLTCARPSSRSWRIASARLERRRSKRKPSTRSTRLRGREIVVTRAGGPSAFATMALRPRASLSDRRPPQARPSPGRQSGLAFARGPVAAKELTHARPRCFTSLWHHDCMYANAEAAGVSLVASEARPGQLPLRRAFCSRPRQVKILRRPVFLHTGTGTAQTTAISTAAITAVIFSLVDRSIASSKERNAEHRARPWPLPVHRLAVYVCDADHAPTGYPACLSPRPLVGFGWRRGLRVRGWLRGRPSQIRRMRRICFRYGWFKLHQR